VAAPLDCACLSDIIVSRDVVKSDVTRLCRAQVLQARRSHTGKLYWRRKVNSPRAGRGTAGDAARRRRASTRHHGHCGRACAASTALRMHLPRLRRPLVVQR
jgi:hypothetical protein